MSSFVTRDEVHKASNFGQSHAWKSFAHHPGNARLVASRALEPETNHQPKGTVFNLTGNWHVVKSVTAQLLLSPAQMWGRTNNSATVSGYCLVPDSLSTVSRRMPHCVPPKTNYGTWRTSRSGAIIDTDYGYAKFNFRGFFHWYSQYQYYLLPILALDLVLPSCAVVLRQ